MGKLYSNGLEWGTNGYTNTCVALRGVLTLFDLLFSKWDDDPQRRERVQESAQGTSSGMAHPDLLMIWFSQW